MNKNNLWSVMFWNIVAIGCWLALSIIFNKWWLIFFALLFLGFPKTIIKYYRTCDKCGKRSPYAYDYNSALDKAKDAGWIHVVKGNKDYCPECKDFKE